MLQKATDKGMIPIEQDLQVYSFKLLSTIFSAWFRSSSSWYVTDLSIEKKKQWSTGFDSQPLLEQDWSRKTLLLLH